MYCDISIKITKVQRSNCPAALRIPIPIQCHEHNRAKITKVSSLTANQKPTIITHQASRIKITKKKILLTRVQISRIFAGKGKM